MVQNVAITNRRILIIFNLIDLESKYLRLVVAILMQQALWRWWLMTEGLVWRGNDKIVKLLLSKGADVNAQGGGYSSALQLASDGGHNKTVKLLLSKGAVNA